MLACRVIRRHSNPDFDWLLVGGGVGHHVDDLLKVLGAPNERETSEPGNDNDLKELRANHDEVVGDEEAPDDDCVSVDDDALDPREFVKKAVSVVGLSKEVLQEAIAFSESPARLSKDFVKNAFPIDVSDGHYLYCVVCGFSGDLLCCDGCPNVVHSHCVALPDVPDGDWFCEECSVSKSSAEVTKPAEGRESSNVSISVATKLLSSGEGKSIMSNPVDGGSDSPAKENCSHFGRVDFDDGKIELVMSLLEELRNSRPTQRVKKASIGGNVVEDADDDFVSVSVDDGNDPLKGISPKKKRGRPRELRVVDDKLSRGRPSKRLAPGHALGAETWNDTEAEPRDSDDESKADSDPGPRKRKRRTTNLSNIDVGQALGSWRKRLWVKPVASTNGECNIATEAVPILRTLKVRRAMSRDLGSGLPAKSLKGVNHNGCEDVKTILRSTRIAANATVSISAILSVDSTGSVPRQKRSSPRKSRPPVRFVDVLGTAQADIRKQERVDCREEEPVPVNASSRTLRRRTSDLVENSKKPRRTGGRP